MVLVFTKSKIQRKYLQHTKKKKFKGMGVQKKKEQVSKWLRFWAIHSKIDYYLLVPYKLKENRIHSKRINYLKKKRAT